LDKNKIIEAAAKLVAKGAYDKAIKEYQKILDVDPKDVRILQKMGELYQKKNDNAQAAIYFTKVAESYTNDGFFLKAVALYKQVLKLDPSLVEINLKLADLHQQLQLLGEAMGYFQIVANHYDKAGDTRKSLEVLKRMVDLDPDKVASRVKLADLYVREGLNAEAVSEFTRAAEHLKRNNQTDDYLRVAERLSSLQPDNLQLAKELAEMYLQRHDQKRALAKLQACFKADNRDIDTLRLLAVAFQGLGQTSKTISVYKELARAWQEKGQLEEADQVWSQVAQLDPADVDVAARLAQSAPLPPPPPAALPEAPAWSAQPSAASPRAPAPAATAVTQAAPSAGPARSRGDTVAKLLTETDVYVKYGLHDKALEHLRKVFAVEPENIDAHEKAYAIYVSSNNPAQAFEQLLNVLRLHTRTGDSNRAQPYLATILQQNPGHPEVPVFVSMLGGAAAPAADADRGLGDASAGDEGAIIVESGDELYVAEHSTDEGIVSAEVAFSHEEPLDQELLSSGVSLVPDEISEFEAAELQPPAPDEQWETPEAADEDPALLAAAAAADEEPGFSSPLDGPALGDDEDLSTGQFPLADDDPMDTGSMAVTANGGAPPLTTTPMHPPVGLGDATHEVPTRVTHRVDPSFMTTTSGVSSPMFDAPALEQDNDWGSTNEEVSNVVAMEEPVVAPPEEEPAAEELDEATFFVDQGLYEEAREILETVLIAYPGHERAGLLLAALESAVAAAAPAQGEASFGTGESLAFDLAQELADELGDEPSVAPLAQEDYQVSVEEVFAEFKRGLEKVVKPEDVDTHYDLGVAYKEMGLIEDAVSEFSIARKGCVGKRKEIDCLSMVGLLHQLQGDGLASVDAFMQALTSEHATGEVEKSLRYDLGIAHELAGQQGRALSQFLRVQQVDPGYRDVEALVARLSAIVAPEDDAPPPRPRSGGAGARKVGYV
jgi:pilus assembly protein FimV